MKKSNSSKDTNVEEQKEHQSWTPEEQVRYLCPEGVMPLEDLRKYVDEITED
jgi:hypothetical protein